MYVSQLIFTGLTVIIGIAVCVAPIIRGIRKKAALYSSSDELKTMQRERSRLESEQSDKERTKYDDLYDAISNYNELLYQNGQNEFTGELPAPEGENLQLYLDDKELKIMALLTIKGHYYTRVKAKQKDKKEQKYAVSMEVNRATLFNCLIPVKNTSIPIGGNNTLSVLYGRPRKGLGFENKFDISKGDIITIETIWDKISYEIDDLALVSASDTESLKIVPDKDILVLMIAEPKDKKRHCIFASRIKGNEDSDEII